MTINRNCCACGRPILPGEPRWTGREPEEFWHYDCWRRVEDHVENNQGGVAGPLVRAGHAMERLKRRLGP